MIHGRRPTTGEEAVAQVAIGSKIAADAGYADITLGHVSVRGPDGGSMYIKRKGMAMGSVAPHDVVRVDLEDDEALSDPSMHLEAVMHLEAYRARDDIGCVIHGHPPYATALGATDGRLEFVSHDGVLFHDGIGRYEDSADLISTSDQGRKVAQALGTTRVVLLKNHGVMVVGQDIRWAMLAALTLERAIQLQVLAGSLGRLQPIPGDEAEAMFATKYQDHFLDEYWTHWTESVG